MSISIMPREKDIINQALEFGDIFLVITKVKNKYGFMKAIQNQLKLKEMYLSFVLIYIR